MNEDCKPVVHATSKGFLGKIKFFLRCFVDLQLLTIYLNLRKTLPGWHGKVLDIGCGNSPFRFLLKAHDVDYTGIDTVDSGQFDYSNPEIVHFDGYDIPFGDQSFDFVICTEVLEHVSHYQHLADEIYRVMKNGAEGVITVPWSARYHYIPYDYFRYTPSTLKTVFRKFSGCQVLARGTDLSSISSKLIVVFYRYFTHLSIVRLLLFPLWALFSPILVLALLTGYLSVFFHLGSENDPLGYTICIKK
jgi:SAM-dependent methyltransferase